ncbi:MAG: hypothetical protein JSS97_05265 [Actinobacteria bacterium]|nr:hypothetical protein [Actinomycetota bacterium]
MAVYRSPEKGSKLGIDLNRRRSLWLVAPIALIAVALSAAPASAQQYQPKPQGEDIAFLQLGTVGELVTLELYRSAAHSKALDTSEKHTFKRLADQTSKGWLKLNSFLGEGAISREIFSVKIPASVLRSRAKTVALAVRFEKLLTGLYLSGVQSTLDPPTRLLIGRHLAMSSRDLTALGELGGGQAGMGTPKPLSVEYVGEQFESYLGISGA